EINEASPFHIQTPLWSDPFSGFSHNQTRLSKFMDALMKKNIVRESRPNVICVLGDWRNVAEGIFFTDQALYVNTPKNSMKQFRLRYDEIKEIKYNATVPRLTIMSNTDSRYHI